MTAASWLYLGAFALVLTLLALPIGRYMADVFADPDDTEHRPGRVLRAMTFILGPVERLLYRAAGIHTEPAGGPARAARGGVNSSGLPEREGPTTPSGPTNTPAPPAAPTRAEAPSEA